MKKIVIAGALGNCVHVAGAIGFLGFAEEAGYETVFLGAAVSIEDFAVAIERYDPEMVGVGYRLTPDVGLRLCKDLIRLVEQKDLSHRRFVFGGTPPVCAAVDELQFFERSFTGLENPEDVLAFLKGKLADNSSGPKLFGNTLPDRIETKRPLPILRHHFGLPDMQSTLDGVRKIAESEVLDVISIGPDQNAQECFFRPCEMDASLSGAGGVPVRSSDDLKAIYQASRTGNNPLLRIYSGTSDLLKWADVAVQTISNAWGAVPLCWYSVLDGRSKRSVENAITENQVCMRWYGERNIPLEVNEAHHWSLRDAHDSLSVAMAYLAAYNARSMGVERYVAQYMFNTPAGVRGAMDLAKILAQVEMVESLHSPKFTSYRQVRAGLQHLSPRLMQAKGQLAASTMLSLAVEPHIIHVVGFCEGDHVADADDVIESCEIVRGVLRNGLWGLPDTTKDPTVQERKSHLIAEAKHILRAITSLARGEEDPFISPRVLTESIELGILDAPQLKGNPHAAGKLVTRVIRGAVEAVDAETKTVLTECRRLELITGAPQHK